MAKVQVSFTDNSSITVSHGFKVEQLPCGDMLVHYRDELQSKSMFIPYKQIKTIRLDGLSLEQRK